MIEGSVDPDVIAGKFASYFTSIFSCNDPQKANSIKQDYDTLRANYSGLPVNENHNIDTELVSNVVCDLTHEKVVDINGLSAEHLYYCQPSLGVVLSRLFQLMLMCSYVPVGFRHSYIVPIPKSSQCSNKAISGLLPSVLLSVLLYPKSLNIAYLKDFSRRLLHLEANLVLRKVLVAATPFG